jgi:hypothetical protein
MKRYIDEGMGLVAWLIMALLALAMFGAWSAFAAQIELSWTFAEANTDGTPITDLAGANVFWGTEPGKYTEKVQVPGGEPGATVTYILRGLVEGTTYYLNGTAYNTAGLESDFATEVAKIAVDVTPQVPGPHDVLAAMPARRQVMVIRQTEGQWTPLVIWQTYSDDLKAWVDE